MTGSGNGSTPATAWDFARLNASLGVARAIRGLDYVRCLEFPLVYSRLDPEPGMRILDAGSRSSVFPVFLASRHRVEVTAVDLDPAVHDQERLASRARLRGTVASRVADLRSLPFPDRHFDRITAISTIEHVPGPGDADAIRELARVLAPGGRLLLTVPVGSEPRDFFLDRGVYAEAYRGEPVFFQRHYNRETLESRLLRPSGLRETERAWFGEPETPFFNRFWVLPRWLRPVKAAYAWLGPAFAGRYLRVVEDPDGVALPAPPMITANGVFVALERES